MPIKTETNVTTGQVELVCKSNGVTTTVDKWKPLPPDMLQLNPNSDEPDKKKDQTIYIDQKSQGIMIVDSDKLDPKYPLFTTHEQAWMYKVFHLFFLKCFSIFFFVQIYFLSFFV
jgi:hypothetical protein